MKGGKVKYYLTEDNTCSCGSKVTYQDRESNEVDGFNVWKVAVCPKHGEIFPKTDKVIEREYEKGK